jgi:hypothetical protein
MRLLALAIPLCLGCAAPPPARQAENPAEEPPLLLSSYECPDGQFRGSGIGGTEGEALSLARSELAKQVNSSVKVTAQHILTQKESGEKEHTSSDYESKTLVEADLSNAHDARIEHKKQGGNKVGIVVCMTRSDAAKGFVERLKPIAAALEFAANAAIDAKHPKDKSDAWQKTKSLWGEFMPLQTMIEGLDKQKAALFEPVAALYAKAKDNYLNYCQTAKLYWNPEAEEVGDLYSGVAFSKLSKNLKLEKASCRGNGISLIYKNTGHECKYAGMFRCSHKPSLLIASCYGEEYRLLENPNVETFQKVEEVALAKLREKLEYEAFWGDWEQEIKQWRPICE